MAGAPTPRVSEGSPGPSSSPEAASEFANGAGWPRCTPFSAARPGAAPLSNGAFRTARMSGITPTPITVRVAALAAWGSAASPYPFTWGASRRAW